MEKDSEKCDICLGLGGHWMPKQFRDRTSPICRSPVAEMWHRVPLLQHFAICLKICFLLWTTPAHFEWSAELLHDLSLFVFHFSGKTWHLERITVRYLNRNIWYVNSHEQNIKGIFWICCHLSNQRSLQTEPNVGFQWPRFEREGGILRFLHNFNCEQGKPFPAKRKHLKWIHHHLPNDQQIECLGVERI